ncbi:hypothetical protein FHR34_001084 [Kitasatospora kifunensis]|uniref:Uncharacterized protein n=1 Tax=Kitasatospora kifunensis TaxID=58351 RepID=A0A7W7QZP9_KITKI|nr:hypothetical protein [Kitasatospora kifunensis]
MNFRTVFGSRCSSETIWLCPMPPAHQRADGGVALAGASGSGPFGD